MGICTPKPRPKPIDICRPSKDNVNGQVILEQIVADYNEKYKEPLEAEFQPYRDGERGVYDCVHSRHHQGRFATMREASHHEAAKRIKDNKLLERKYANFEELYQAVNNLITDINQIGPLTIYDTSLYLGQMMSPIVEPEDRVYYSCGTQKGLQFLLNKKISKPGSIETESLRAYFGDMDSKHIENLLCVMKHQLEALNKSESR